MENKKEREEILELTEDMVVKDSKGKKGRRVVITIAIILAAFLLGYWAWWSIETDKIAKSVLESDIPKSVLELQKQIQDVQAKLDEIEAKLKEMEESIAEAEAEKATTDEEREWLIAALELANVKQNKGIEHVLIKQFINDPFTFGFEGDATPKVVKKWAKKRAHQIATLAGYYDWKFGREVRVKKANSIAYLLVKENGKIKVKEYTKDKTCNFKTEPESIQELAENFASAKFKGDKPGGINQQYEYLFTGG